MQDGEMSYDAGLLCDLISEGVLPPKAIARMTDLHVNTVYAYQHGQINIPIVFWQKLYAATRDGRIADLMFRGLPVALVLTDQLPDLSDVGALRVALQSTGEFYELMRHLVDIVADGKINADDAAAVKRFNAAYPQFASHVAALWKVINTEFSKAAAATKGSNP